ncbi:MAG: 2-succinyl-5-enolpyruvyl-6-hydroxy-3-cyclohexene-1-carboxylic-acid synthase [Polyangiales bacterium]
MGTPADLQTGWARLVIGSLVQAGVRDAVVSPGSRSTPFVLAAIRHGGLRLVSAFDERSAAHFALGQARATGRPSLLICTSGSAPANYFPAVVEAYEAGIPLVILSADRPPELLGCGANQTTDQLRMYGNHVRLFANLGEPRADASDLRAVRRLMFQATDVALGPVPGPVHLNAQARKPLEPHIDDDPAVRAAQADIDALLAAPALTFLRDTTLDSSVTESVAALLNEARRPVILCGPGSVEQQGAADPVARLAQKAGAMVLAEAGSQFRFGFPNDGALGAFDVLWTTAAGRTALAPDFVLQLGDSPVSKGWEILSRSEITRVVVHPWAWADPSSSAVMVVHADLERFAASLADRDFDLSGRDLEFQSNFRAAERMVWGEASCVIGDAEDALTEAAVAPAIVDEVPSGVALVLGNSLPIRDVERWVPPRSSEIRVFVQRGVSGIDGLVSSAAGVASRGEGATVLLVGDVSFLHDVNGLALATSVARPLVIVVLNNGGGRIFEQLPLADSEPRDALRYFTTPHDANLAGAAALYGCRFDSVDLVSTLRSSFRAALDRKGCTVIEARVPAQSAKEQGASLIGRVADVLTRGAL